MDILKQLKDVVISVLPIGIVASVLSIATGVMDGTEFCRFMLSCLLVIIGLTLFLTGVEVGITPIGGHIGSSLTKSRSLLIMLGAALLLGVIITIPEPDVQVLATEVNQVNPSIPVKTLTYAIAAGVGLFFAISLARTVLNWPMKIIIAISYAFIFLIAFFNDDFLVSVAFDSGGATTGPLSVPFIMALGTGVAAIRKHNEEAEFGYVAFSSIGPVLSVLILGLVFRQESLGSIIAEEASDPALLSLLGEKFQSVGISLAPLVAVCILMQILVLKTPKTEAIREFSGIIYSYIGIVIFFTGVEYSFSDVAKELGSALISINPLLLYGAGFVFGLCVVLAEPAVIVLTDQVEEASSGRISKKVMLATLSLGVGCAVVLALIRTVHSLSIWTFILPGYILVMLFMIKTPGLFSAIGFDSGGVATGPMSSAFLLPLAMGAASASSSATLSASFGMIAMIAMMPVLLIEILGIIYQSRLRKTGKGDK